MKQRQWVSVIDSQPTADGDGVKIRRIAGARLNQSLDPFLLLDEIRSEDGADYIGGFPSHPHRGFETVTYMLDGVMQHRDHMGNEGLLGPGDVQWMTAGRGVIHSEMPQQREGLLHGFQLWLNLPAAGKMRPASYRDYSADAFPVKALESGTTVKVIAGEVEIDGESITGPVIREHTRPVYMDVSIPAGGDFEWRTDPAQTVLVYVFEGGLEDLSAGQMGVFVNGDRLVLRGTDRPARALVLAGTPLREPIKQYGPFVMNTVEEIEQAIADYNSGRLVG